MNAYILAGGRGTRLSASKGFLKVGGVPIVERVARAAASLVEQIVLVGDPLLLSPVGFRVITEPVPDTGPLAALCAALQDAAGAGALLLPWDAPFLTRPALQYLLGRRHEADAVVPKSGDFAEPLCAVYGPGCRAPAEAALQARRFSVRSFYDRIAVRWIEPPELAPFGDWDRLFFNVNTPADYQRALTLAEAEA
jgi:molybdopterin-guanine dinucleotide biosynthesis protein A